MQKVRSRANNALLLLVDLRFQVLFHSPLGVLFTFPSLYLFTIGHYVVFSLRWWSTWIPSRFLVSVGTRDAARAVTVFDHRAVTFFGLTFQTVDLTISVSYRGPTTPR